MALVRNLATGQEVTYTCAPKDAVIAAYAQQQGDFNTWDYTEKYGALTKESGLCWRVEDWATFKDEREG